MHKPLGVIFDFGDTVLHQESFDPVTGNNRLLEFATNNAGLTATDVQLVADEIGREVNQLRDESHIEFHVQSFQRLLYETLGLSFRISYFQMEREFWNAAVKLTPVEGISDVLETLEAHHIKAGIVSNTTFSGATLREELAKHNLAHRFSFVISSGDYGFRKPNPRIFEVAIKKMNLNRQDIWFVGDKPEYDIKGAVACGLCPVWYNARNEATSIDFDCLVVRNWREFREKLDSLYEH
jgi:putative hydrolase of the HAD superfamily